MYNIYVYITIIPNGLSWRFQIIFFFFLSYYISTFKNKQNKEKSSNKSNQVTNLKIPYADI